MVQPFRRHPAPSAGGKPRLQPRLEALEDRQVPAVIAGCVFNDINNNGLQEAGEVGIPNSTIELRDATGVVATTTTDATGHYRFAVDPRIDTAPKTQSFEAVFDSTRTDQSRTQLLKQFDPALGVLTGVQIIADGAITSQVTIENMNPGSAPVEADLKGTLNFQVPGATGLTASVSGKLEATLPAFDGTPDLGGSSARAFDPYRMAASAGLVNITDPAALAAYVGTGSVTVAEQATAENCACGPGNLLAMIRTTADAKVKVVYTYTPRNDLRPGQYTLVQTQQPPGLLDGLESRDHMEVLPGSNRTDTISVNLTTGDSVENCFGEVPPAELCGGTYVDTNDNGQWEAGENPLGGVSVFLTGSDDRGDAVTQSLVTGADGKFCFTNLRPGVYALTKTNTPGGFLDGKDTVGTPGGLVATNVFSSIVLPAGVHGENNNFGHILPASVAGAVYLDSDRSGTWTPGDPPIPSVTVNLTGTDDQGQSVSRTQQTTSVGAFYFGDLRPGQYTLTEIQPTPYLQAVNKVGSLGGTVNGDQMQLTVAAGQHGIDYLFGEVVQQATTPPVTPPVVPTPTPVPPSPTPPVGSGDGAGVSDPMGPPNKYFLTGRTWDTWSW